MATIAFFVDFHIGHIYPTFGLASELTAHHHRVVYFGIPDAGQTVRENGFEFHPVMEDIYPLGYMKEIFKKYAGQPAELNAHQGNDHFIPLMRQDILWSTLERIHPDLIISNIFIPIESLIVYFKTRLPQVIFVPFFTELPLEKIVFTKLTELANEIFEIYSFSEEQGFKIDSLRDLIAPIMKFPAIIPCPGEFDLPTALERENFHYIGPSIRQPISRGQFNWPALPPDTKIIFASLGSQPLSSVYDIEKVRSFFCKIIAMMNSPLSRGWHLILSLGASEDLGDIGPFPSSITALRWVPQLEVLQRASLIITHGGLGTIKESIFYGVPMIVWPLAYDQFLNCKRIEHHNLGKALDIDTVSVEEILETVTNILHNETIQRALKNMQQLFRQYEDSHQGVKIIEKTLDETI